MTGAEIALVVVAIISLAGAALSAWLTYKGTKMKVQQESQSAKLDYQSQTFSHLQNEVTRLRGDLKDRDDLVRLNWSEIMDLRKQLLTMKDTQHILQLRMAELSIGVQVLMKQLDYHDIKPHWSPPWPLEDLGVQRDSWANKEKSEQAKHA